KMVYSEEALKKKGNWIIDVANSDAESNADSSKRQRKITTLDEHNIPDPLVEKPTESQIIDAIRRTGWEHKKLVDYIYQ
ncbi:13182_t:CDS:2, partial [Entrophospora sp. SA101]